MIPITVLSEHTMSEASSTDWKKSVELALKVIATLVALFGVVKYFVDNDRTHKAQLSSNSLEFIERYSASELLKDRKTVLDFWIENSEYLDALLKHGVRKSIYEDQVYALVLKSKRSDELFNSIFRLGNFFDQVHFCKSGSIFNEQMLETYFCESISNFNTGVGVTLSKVRHATSIQTVGQGANEFGEKCDR